MIAKDQQLPLTNSYKLPHLTGAITITADGRSFPILIILPNLKTLKTIDTGKSDVVYASSLSGWMTKNIFIFYCIFLISEISKERLTMKDELKEEPFLLICDGHPSRYCFVACYLLYLFNIDLLVLPPHSTHALQPFNFGVSSPLKTYFTEAFQIKTSEFQIDTNNIKIKLKEMRKLMIESFIDAACKSCTPTNIVHAFNKCGISPFDPIIPLSSDYAMDQFDSNLIPPQGEWLNSEENLQKLYMKEYNKPFNPNEFQINFQVLMSELKSASIANGRALSDLSYIFYEENSSIKKINL